MLSVISMHVQNANAETNCWIQKCNDNGICHLIISHATPPGMRTAGKWLEKEILHHDC